MHTPNDYRVSLIQMIPIDDERQKLKPKRKKKKRRL